MQYEREGAAVDEFAGDVEIGDGFVGQAFGDVELLADGGAFI